LAKLPIVALVGRPNVGKSALFNRLIQQRSAIVEDTPNITRDRIYSIFNWNGRDFTVIDTGGIDPYNKEELRKLVQKQTQQAIKEADLLVMVTDAQEGLQYLDLEVAQLLKTTKKPVLLAVNKGEGKAGAENVAEFYALNLGEPFVLSALHGMGTGDLLDAVCLALPQLQEPIEVESIKVAIVGRPNVGKSSLLNAILGEERVLVHDVPGTTRDAIDTEIYLGEKKFTLIDTAGLRRKSKVKDNVEFYSVLRTQKAISRAQVVLLVLDALDGFIAMDGHIAGITEEEGKGCIIIVNKIDMIDKTELNQWRKATQLYLRQKLESLTYAPILFTSAKEHTNIIRILPEIINVYDECRKEVPLKALNHVIKEASFFRPPPRSGKFAVKINKVKPSGSFPPAFALYCNYPKSLDNNYLRYLENHLRAAFGFVGTPIRLYPKRGE
jgi:GTPase